MTLKQFAEFAGYSIRAVQQAVSAGRIDAVKEGNGYVIHDPEKAKTQWVENSSYLKSRKRKQETFVSAGPDGSERISIAEAERREKVWKSKIAELKAKQAAGELIEKVKVDDFLFDKARKVRDAILGVPSRICAELAAETDPHQLEVKLTSELVKALEELADVERE